jgi:diguanylate cyclase (GGDEF)-like protein/PAS domain S-box-containing protein
MSFLAVVTIICLISLAYSLHSKYTQINQAWLKTSELEKRQTIALATINKGFGYGGFIHHFKNYILRKDDSYLAAAKVSLSMTYQGIDDYLELSSQINDQANLQQIMLFKNTVDAYAEKIELAELLVTSENAIDVIDSQVIVDDSEALQALDFLFDGLAKSTENIQAQNQHVVTKIADTIFYTSFVAILLIAIVFVFFMRQSKQIASSYMQIKTLVNATPSAIIQANADGEIRAFNQKALDYFQYDAFEFSRLTIEDLVPEQYRTRHQILRKEFLENTSDATMNTRNAEFTARRKNGEIFPVSVSIAPFSDGDESGSISILKDLTAEKELVAEASKDPLTSLFNRRAAERFLDQAIQHIDRQNDAVSIILFDIDFFKHVNDEHGHAEGDRVLKKVAALMSSNVRDTDLVSRWGGEEFLIICPATDNITASQVGEKIRQLIETTFKEDTIHHTVSAGIAVYDPLKDSQATLFSRADKALYHAKEKGRNRIVSL